MGKMKDKIKKSCKSHTLFSDAICYFFRCIKYSSPYTTGLIAMDKIFYDVEKKYSKIAKKFISKNGESKKSDYIWIFWYQGIENAPEIVKFCYESVKKYFSNKNIVIITKNNISDYIEIPEFIMKKVENGIISLTHFSDIIRTKLLIEYGGLWLDSTVLCTGENFDFSEELDLFVYRNGWFDKENINMASWLIYAKSNNVILELTYYLLEEYWKTHNYLCNYFLFHMFFKIATDIYSEEWKKVPYSNHINNHLLFNEFSNKFSKTRLEKICKITSFHKLSYKIDENFDKGSFYCKLVKNGENNGEC